MMNSVFYKILLVAFFSGITFSLFGQREKVKFYYTINSKIYEGSFTVSYKFYDGSSESKADGIIDYEKYDPENVRILAEVSDLRWERTAHADDYRIAFVSDLLDNPEMELKLDTKYTQYLKPGISRKIFYSLNTNLYEATPTAIVISCLVIKNDFNPDTDGDSEDFLEDGDFIGLGITLKPVLLVPKTDTSTKDEIDLMWGLLEIFAEGYDDELVNISYLLAEFIEEEQFDKAKDYFEKPPSSKFSPLNDSSVGERSSPLKEKIEIKKSDPDQEAFIEAQSSNSKLSYQNYLNSYPNGNYASAARNKIIAMTPFEFNQTRNGDKFTITFSQGVGARPPALTLTDNDDFVIKHRWIGSKQVEIDIPEERETTARFTLGRKEKQVALSNNFKPVAASLAMDGLDLVATGVSGGKPPYKLVVYQGSKKVHTQENINSESHSLKIQELPLKKGSFTAKVMDIREEVGTSFQGALEENTPAAPVVDVLTSKGGDTSNNYDLSWLLLIPIISGTLFLLYRKYA